MGFETKEIKVEELYFSTEVARPLYDWSEVDNQEVRVSSVEETEPVKMHLYGNKLY